MRILQILPKIPYPPVDGHTKSMWGVIKYLRQCGHEIDVIAYSQQKDFRNDISEIEKYAKLYPLDLITRNSIAGAVVNLFSKTPYNLSKYVRPELDSFISGHLKKNKYDIIHITNAHMGWIVDRIRSLCDTPVVLRQENLELTIMERYYKKQSNPLLKFYAYIQYRKFIKYEPVLCSRFDCVIMMSAEDERRLKRFNPHVKTVTIPLGIEKELLEVNRTEIEKYSLVHIGSLDWYPNYDGFKWFVNCIFPAIVRKFKDVKLYHYGGGIPGKFFFPESVKDNIIVKGFVKDIFQELADKSLAIVPLRIGSGIRVKILELLASGVNIVTTPMGMEGIPVENGKEILVAENELGFESLIIEFFDEKFDGKNISLKGKEFIKENYLWESIAEKFEDTYRKLLKGGE
ncbi:MAG TPA: glycosyltransferase family 4 protein [Melioribacteraceae bacterium]|nr:glycosyltransferase family 4 protein [Melioribacteraceae bacterium]